MNSGKWSVEDTLHQLALIPKGEEPYLEPFQHGTMRLGMYAPQQHDPQTPHDQDELYFIVSGSGVFVHGEERSDIRIGDALFVAAGVEHRFDAFTDDFSAWVVFWGETGGEVENV